MSAERTFAVTFFDSRHATRGETRDLSWQGVRELSIDAERSQTPKEALPMWSPAVFSGGTKLANVVSLSTLVLDVDDTRVSRVDTVSGMPFACIAHASFSHGPTAEKFRLVARTSRSHTAAEHPALWGYAQLILRGLGTMPFTYASYA